MCVVTGVIAGGLLLGCNTSPAFAQDTQAVATLARQARVPVRVQPGAVAEPLLHLWIRSYTPPQHGNLEATVSLMRGSKESELGRFVIFPAAAFFAARPEDERGYSFDARNAVAELRTDTGPLIVQVRLAPLDPAVAVEGGELTLSRAELRPRP
jgi:hypothetical protein